MGGWGDGEMGGWGDGEMGGWGDGEMGRWGEGEMGRWGDGEMGRWGELSRSHAPAWERAKDAPASCGEGARPAWQVENASFWRGMGRNDEPHAIDWTPERPDVRSHAGAWERVAPVPDKSCQGRQNWSRSHAPAWERVKDAPASCGEGARPARGQVGLVPALRRGNARRTLRRPAARERVPRGWLRMHPVGEEWVETMSPIRLTGRRSVPMCVPTPERGNE